MRAGYSRQDGISVPVWTPELDHSFQVSLAGLVLVETAPDGHVRWRLPLTGGPAWRSFDQSQYPEGCLAGHLLVMTMDDYVWAVDILAKKGRVLWSKGTVSKRRDRAEERLMMPQVPEMARQAKPLANPLPRLIAATSEYVCFEQDRRLLAVEPLSGSPLWTRKTWPRGVT